MSKADDLVSVMLCVNDGDNGTPTDRVRAMDVDDIGAESPYFSMDDCARVFPKYAIHMDGNRHRIKVGRFFFDICGHRRWVGNWCWDAVTMSRSEARRLLLYLVRYRHWHITASPLESDLLPAEKIPSPPGPSDVPRPAGVKYEPISSSTAKS